MKIDLTLTPGVQGVLQMNEDMERSRNTITYKGIIIDLVDKSVELKAARLPLEDEIIEMIKSIISIAEAEAEIYEASQHLITDNAKVTHNVSIGFSLVDYKEAMAEMNFMYKALVGGDMSFIDALSRLTHEERKRTYQVLMARNASNMDTCSRDKGDRLRAAQDSMLQTLSVDGYYDAAKDIKLIANMPALMDDEFFFIFKEKLDILEYKTKWIIDNVYLQLLVQNKNLNSPLIYRTHYYVINELVDTPEWLLNRI